MLSKIVSSIIALITFISAFLGLYRVKDTSDFDCKSWMASISDEAYISEISIPGTHDSCALYEPIHPSAKCQDYTISDQLDMGVRFLDMRGVALFTKIGMVHGPIYQAVLFDKVLKDCYDFLNENPSETIIMSIKEDFSYDSSTEKFIGLVEKYISNDPDMWYIGNTIPQLKNVRGKIVLFNRYNGSSSYGLSTSPWRDNCSFENNQSSYSLNVQDYYNIPDVDAKWVQAVDLFNECFSCNEKSTNLYINFMSGYFGKIPDMVSVAEGMNPRFIGFMSNAPKGCYGIVLFDFVTPQLCNTLIAKNVID